MGGNRQHFVCSGDSFAAGHGIRDIDHRVSGVLQGKLGNGWIVATIAQNGWDTVDEYNALIQHAIKPNMIVVSYCLNDIERSARQHGFGISSDIVREPDGVLRFLLKIPIS